MEMTDAIRMRACALIVLLAFVVGALALSGCASAPPVRDRVVEVKVPVAVQPIAAKDVPPPPKPLGPRPSSLSAAADVLLSKVCELEAYVLKADPLLRLSAGGKPVELPPYPECERK
jgi:hypothetical protein